MARRTPDLRLLTLTELAAELGKHPHTLRKIIRRGEGPPAVRLGASHLFRLSTVRQWLADQEREISAVDTPALPECSQAEPARNPEDHK